MLLQRRLYRVQFPDADDIAWVGSSRLFEPARAQQEQSAMTAEALLKI
jgi:hypothetical protein